jgi:hypothetical protein
MDNLDDRNDVKRLLHHKNMILYRSLGELPIVTRRQMYAQLRQHTSPEHTNFVFPNPCGCTVSEFATFTFICHNNKSKFNQVIKKYFST